MKQQFSLRTRHLYLTMLLKTYCFFLNNPFKQFIQLTLENLNTQFIELFDSSNKFFGSLNITHFFRQKNSRYLESRYLGRSNKIVGPLYGFLSFSRTFDLTFRPKFESSIKFERYIRFFGKKNISQKLLVFLQMFS